MNEPQILTLDFRVYHAKTKKNSTEAKWTFPEYRQNFHIIFNRNEIN